MLAESGDGRWAADTTGRAESRQNGKGDEIEVVELWGLTQRAEAILHTAHEAATAASAHLRLIGLVEGHRDLRAKIKKKQSWNGNYSLLLNNDGIIVWRTRTGAGGRGLDDISRIVVDEAQHAQPEELASSLPILSVNPNPQKNFIGSGGIAGKSGFWWRQRRRALLAASAPGRFAWMEHSAEEVSLTADGRIVSSVGDISDPELWRRANPAYPSRISHDFLLDQLETLGAEMFAREHLCIWDPEPATSLDGDFDLTAWLVLADPKAPRGKKPVFGVDVGADRMAHVAVAWHRGDGRAQVMLADTGLSPLMTAPRLAALAADWKGSVVLGGPAAALESEIRGALVMTGSDFADACGRFDDLVRDGGLRHGNQPELNGALQAARWKPYGSAGGRMLNLRDAPTVGPLAAAIRALHGLLGAPTHVPAPPLSASTRSDSGGSYTADLSTLSF